MNFKEAHEAIRQRTWPKPFRLSVEASVTEVPKNQTVIEWRVSFDGEVFFGSCPEEIIEQLKVYVNAGRPKEYPVTTLESVGSVE